MTHCNASRREFTGQFGALLGAHSLGLMGSLGPSAVHAQAWPSRPVSMIAPYPAGGGVDTVARLIADQLATRLGQAVTIDNKPGAGATIGATLLARSAPDGYTLMLGSIVDYAIAPHTIKSLPFDIQRDLIPVVEVGFGTVGLIVNADLPAKNLKELIAMARAKPGELSFASSGVGGLQHLNAEMFKQMAGVDILHVPYKGTAQFMPDLLSGRDNQRTFFKGYLFVGEVLLNESGMQNHPLTPMLDANLVRVLQAQTRRKVGLIDHGVVAGGAAAIAARIAALKTQNVGVAVVDAVSNDDLMRLGLALKDMPLVAAGSGVAIGLPQNFGIAPSAGASALPPRGGWQAVVSGSCSTATNRQVADFIGRGHPALALDPLQIADDVAKRTDPSAKALAWAAPLLKNGPVLVYSTAAPADVKSVQATLGVDDAGAMVDRTLAGVARGLVALGVRQLIVAGGETSGACVQALNVAQMQIGWQIDPGVPWCHAKTNGVATGAGAKHDLGLHLALKSGNFGTDDFFSKAFELLP